MNFEVGIVFEKLSTQGLEDLCAQFKQFGAVAPLRGMAGFTVTTRVRLFAENAKAAALEAGGTVKWVRQYPDRTAAR